MNVDAVIAKNNIARYYNTDIIDLEYADNRARRTLEKGW